MRKHFCDAMRGLREVKKDQDVKEVIESDDQDQAGDDGNADEGNWWGGRWLNRMVEYGVPNVLRMEIILIKTNFIISSSKRYKLMMVLG